MKKLKIWSILMLAVMMMPLVASAKQVRIDDIDYELYTENNNNYARVIRNFWKPNKFEYKGHIVIPETVTYKKKVYVVREIGGMRAEFKGAFEDCYGLLSVTLPQTIQVISRNAFKNCTNLTEASIADSVISLGSGVFSGCTSLVSVTLPKEIDTFGTGMFSGCVSLKNVKMPTSLEDLFGNNFYNCNSFINYQNFINFRCFIKFIPRKSSFH